MSFGTWLVLVVIGVPLLAAFVWALVRESVVRVPVGTPVNLLEDETYLEEVFGPYRTAQARAEAQVQAAADAGRTGDLYVLSTVLLAVALFFAGVTASFRSPTLRLVLLTACLLTILISLGRLADLPVASATWTLLN